MLIKEGKEGSKSAYLAHIGGFFTFVAFAGLSLIGWGLNHHCWSKKSCCFKDYHNPLNIRVFWWMSFIGLCGTLACCISGFITSNNFGNKVGTIKCAYERVYYDSIFGEIKTSQQKWEGLEKRNEINKTFSNFLINEKKFNKPFDFTVKKWEKGGKALLDPNVYYLTKFQETLDKEILFKCKNSYGILRDMNGMLICDSNLEDPSSIVYKYINNITRITKYFSDEVNKINDFIDNKGKRNKGYSKELNLTNNNLKEIAEDLNNYKTGFLDKAYYYINISKACGYILVTVYYSILLAIVVCSCFLLWAYSYFKEQKVLYLLMHVAWNILKFFSFSFFMFGAAFGALYLISKDLIGYNKFLFSDSNLAENATTYLLPNGKTKEFLRYCINEEDSNYINNFKYSTIALIKDLYYNRKAGNDTIKNIPNLLVNMPIECYSVSSQNLRNIQETDMTDYMGITILNFTNITIEVEAMLNDINTAFNNYTRRLRNLEGNNIIREIDKLGETIEKLNCGYLKNEIQILYDSLYELSIESRISCALSCCIAFFIEFSIAFYLLVIYHYNNLEFKEDNDTTQKSYQKNKNRKFDLDSQNVFMDKSRPVNMKKNNKKLDLEFDLNQ